MLVYLLALFVKLFYRLSCPLCAVIITSYPAPNTYTFPPFFTLIIQLHFDTSSSICGKVIVTVEARRDTKLLASSGEFIATLSTTTSRYLEKRYYRPRNL